MGVQLNQVTGLIEQVDYIPSPNCDNFPDPQAVNLLVIHCISLPPGEFGGNGIKQLFTNQLDPNRHPYYKDIATMKVSAHVLIRRDGKLIQFVPFNKRAWHAGQSMFMQQSHCNDFSFGIELEGTEDRLFTESQYTQLAELTRELLNIYPKIVRQRIVGHDAIAAPRKTDPGRYFNWQKYFALLD